MIIGVLSKYGVEFLASSYRSFIFTNINHTLQSDSAMAVEFIAKRLEYRIKDSVIARKQDGTFSSLGSLDSSSTQAYTVLEWVGKDIEGFRGTSVPYWSGVTDIDAGSSSLLVSPQTNTEDINTLITILSNSLSGVDDAALYFIGSNNDIVTGYGWDGNISTIQTQNGAMHPISSVLGVGNENQFTPDYTNFVSVSEYYILSWSAYAIVYDDGNLTLHSDYQPWEGESYTDATQQNLLMENVDTFQFMSSGSLIKIQVCVNSKVAEKYSLCKEKTIY